jgi:N-dimethylarginine dimethylaminohydrolase
VRPPVGWTVESVARVLSRHLPLRWIQEPATLDAGDVMHVGRKPFVGASLRTNAEGFRQLGHELAVCWANNKQAASGKNMGV